MMRHKNQELITLPADQEYRFSFEQLNIISIFQRLFTQLAVFMKSYITLAAFDLPSQEVNAQRLLKLSEDFRVAFLLFYGPEIADRMSMLFTNFIASVLNVIEGYKLNDQDLINQSVQNWYQRADVLATFLARVNAFWDENQWRNLFHQYVQRKLEMLVAIFSGDYNRELLIYDRVFDLTTIMGTYMAQGLIARELQREE